MAQLSGALSAFDERALGSDSGALTSQFRVQAGERSYGELSAKDEAD